MRFSQSSFVYFNFSLQQAIRHLHSYGYQGIEVWGGRPHAYRRDLDDEMDEIVALLAHLDMTVCNFIPAQFRYPTILCSLDERVRCDSVRYIQDEIDTALRLGALSVSLCPGMTLFGQDLEKGWSQLRKSIVELLDYTEVTDLVLLIEPAHAAESSLIRKVEEGLRMIDEIGSERLGILLDTGHANLNGEDLAQVVAGLKDVPLHIHIDDNDGNSDAHMIPGEGNIDFEPFAGALGEIGYQGFISAELGFQYTLDPDSAVERTLVVLRELFDRAGLRRTKGG